MSRNQVYQLNDRIQKSKHLTIPLQNQFQFLLLELQLLHILFFKNAYPTTSDVRPGEDLLKRLSEG